MKAKKTTKDAPKVLDPEYQRKRIAIHEYLNANNYRKAWIFEKYQQEAELVSISYVSRCLSITNPRDTRTAHDIVDACLAICGIPDNFKEAATC